MSNSRTAVGVGPELHQRAGRNTSDFSTLVKKLVAEGRLCLKDGQTQGGDQDGAEIIVRHSVELPAEQLT